MSHDRGCYMCFNDRDHAKSCKEWNCPYKKDEVVMKEKKKEAVDHPSHYGGKDNPYEAIKVIEAWNLGFNLGNTVKYISRAGKKDAIVQDLEKAKWYLEREISKLKGEK